MAGKREKKRRAKRRGGGIGEREGRETGALVGGDEVTPRRGGSLGNLRELTAAAADSVRFGVLAIDSQARWAVDGACTRVCMRSEYDVRSCVRVPRDAGIRGRSGRVARDRAWVRECVRTSGARAKDCASRMISVSEWSIVLLIAKLYKKTWRSWMQLVSPRYCIIKFK